MIPSDEAVVARLCAFFEEHSVFGGVKRVSGTGKKDWTFASRMMMRSQGMNGWEDIRTVFLFFFWESGFGSGCVDMCVVLVPDPRIRLGTPQLVSLKDEGIV